MRERAAQRLTMLTAAVALAVALALPTGAQQPGIGAPPPAEAVGRMVATAQAYLKQAEESFARGDFEHARSKFDDAMEVFLSSGYDIRSEASLQAAYRDT